MTTRSEAGRAGLVGQDPDLYVTLRAELARFEREINHSPGLGKATKRNYINHARRFVAWIQGEYRIP